jgi:beta-glucosidase
MFTFATGIENSNPKIANGTIRHDQLESCGFYKHWQTDFELLEEIGVHAVRFGPPLHKTWLGVGKYDWEFADLTLNRLKDQGVTVIADLCHFGVPDWIGDFQNDDFPWLFAKYAQDFAKRYPWIEDYTPINEMLICATFSARLGWWNEQKTDDKSFVTAIRNCTMANAMAMRAILVVAPKTFIQAEACEFTHAENDNVALKAAIRNDERFLTLDLTYGYDVSLRMREFLFDCGMPKQEYLWFMKNRELRPYCVVGHDYYNTSEQLICRDRSQDFAWDVCGFHELASQYHDRYGLPAMHTETNFPEGERGDEAVKWLDKQWRQTKFAMQQHRVPIIGFTWYSLTDQTDWDIALREKRNKVNPLGLYDLDRKIRPVGTAYKHLIESQKPFALVA